MADPQTARVQDDVTTTTTEDAAASQSREIIETSGHQTKEGESQETKRIIWRLEKPMNTRPTRRLVRLALGRIRGKEEDRQEAFRSKLNTSDALNWQSVLKKLETNTPIESSVSWRHTKHVHFDTNIDELYEGDLRQFFLSLLLLTECHVQVLSSSGSVLVLTGDDRAIKRALNRLQKAFSNPYLEAQAVEQGEKFKDSSEDITTHAANEPSPRAVFSNDYQWLELARRGLVTTPTPVGKKQPFNVISFAVRVEVLTLSRPPRLTRMAARIARPSNSDESGETLATQEVTIQELVKHFTNREVSRYASAYSVVRTFQYLAHRRRFPEIRRIFHSLAEAHYNVTASAFNTMLHAAAVAQDLHNFHFILDLMLARKVTPTWESWASLVDLVSKRSMTDAHVIRRRMLASNLLLNPAAQKSIASILVKDDFQQWLDSGKDGRQFLNHYDALFSGGEWLNPSAANALVEIRATRGQFSAVSTLLDEFDGRKCKPNVVTLNTVLTLGAKQGNTGAAIMLASRLLMPEYRIYPNAITYAQLFNLAWHRRSFNLVRVVWRYACLQGHVSGIMGRRIRASVVAFAPPGSIKAAKEADRPSRNEVFRTIAGKFAVGVSHNTSTLTKAATMDAEHWLLLHSTEKEADIADAEIVRERYKRLNAIYQADFTQFGKLLPKVGLKRSLEKALEIDTAWKQTGLVDDLEKMFAGALNVAVVQRNVNDGDDSIGGRESPRPASHDDLDTRS